MPNALTIFALSGLGFGFILLIVGFTHAGTGRHIPRFDPSETFIFGLLFLALAGAAYRSPKFFGDYAAQSLGVRLMLVGLALVGVAMYQQVRHRRQHPKIKH